MPYGIWLAGELQALGLEVSLIGTPAWVEQVSAEVPVARAAALPLYEGTEADYYARGKWHEEKSSYQFARRALELARSWRSDVVHFVFLDSFILSLLAALPHAGHTRVYTTLHSPYFLPRFAPNTRMGRLKAGAQTLALRLLVRRGVRVHVHTPSFATEIGRLTVPGRVQYIAHPADAPLPGSLDGGDEVRRQLGVGPDVQLLLAFGHTRRSKGVDIAIRALAHLPPEYHLMILGTEDEITGEEIARLTSSCGVEGRVHTRLEFLPREEYEPYFAAAAVVVLPYGRGFASQSGVMYIAGAMGVPVAASDAGSTGELVQSYGLGQVFRAEDPADMARVVQLTNAPRYSPQQRRERHEQFTRNHTLRAFAEATLTDYHRT